MTYIKLLRPKDWAKNLFLFIPAFFAGEILDISNIALLLGGFFAYSALASSIYILNDYRDAADDRNHPEKKHRPLASGKANKKVALILSVLLAIGGFVGGYFLDPSGKYLFILTVYYGLNLSYTFGLKNISILDIAIIAAGFVLRVKGGAAITDTHTTEWLTVMIFLLSLFMALAKRRDDVLLKISTGTDMRKSIKGYSLDYLNVMLGLFSAIIVVAYINYTMTPQAHKNFGYRLYYTSLFVIAGVMRYLQIAFVQNNSGSPTKILYRDRFIQITIILWVISFYVILYLRDLTIFE